MILNWVAKEVVWPQHGEPFIDIKPSALDIVMHCRNILVNTTSSKIILKQLVIQTNGTKNVSKEQYHWIPRSRVSLLRLRDVSVDACDRGRSTGWDACVLEARDAAVAWG